MILGQWSHFVLPCEHQKTKSFILLSGGIKWEHWSEIVAVIDYQHHSQYKAYINPKLPSSAGTSLVFDFMSGDLFKELLENYFWRIQIQCPHTRCFLIINALRLLINKSDIKFFFNPPFIPPIKQIFKFPIPFPLWKRGFEL